MEADKQPKACPMRQPRTEIELIIEEALKEFKENEN